MVSKIKGRPLPPLLPLEYCKLERAARMLNCEVDDILHWAEIGVIDLTYKVTGKDMLCGENALYKDDLSWLFKNGEIEFMSPLREGEGFRWSNSATGQFITFEFTPVYETTQEFEETLMAVIKGDQSEAVYSKVTPVGLFNISIYEIHEVSSGAHKLKNPVLFIPGTEIAFLFYDQEINSNDLLIDRESLEKLHKAIVTGTPLKSRFNDADTAKEMRHKELSAASVKLERLTVPLATTIYALSRLAVKLAGKDPDSIKDTPFSALEILTKIMLENDCNAELGYSLGHSTAQGLADVINKAKEKLKSQDIIKAKN